MILAFLIHEKWMTLVHRVSNQIPERDWREKQKVMDDLMGTVELQRKALDSIQKEIMEKEKLCSALRVRLQPVFYGCENCMVLLYVRLLHFWFGFLFFYKETDDIPGITT